MAHRPWPYLLIAVSLLLFLLFACSSTPPISESNQRFYDAKSNLKSSDFKAAVRNLDQAVKSATDDASRQQALVLRTALVAALAEANKQMAEAYYTGAKQPAGQAHTGAFYQRRSDYYRTAQSFLMDAMQSLMDQRSKLANVSTISLEVGFPGFTGTNPDMTKIKQGQLGSDSEALNAELQADRNALAMILSAIAGAGQDPNKGAQVYSAGKVNIDPRVYIIELTNSFMESGAMFELRGLNEPDRLRTVNEVVRGNLDVASKLLAAKPDKDLETCVKKMQADCEKALNKKTTKS